MNAKIIVTLTCSAIVWVFFVSADGELKQCPSPFVSRHIHPDNLTVSDCRKNETCKVDSNYTSVHVKFNVIAPCDTDMDIKKTYCKLFVTSPSKNYTSGCSKNFVSGNSYFSTDYAPEIKKGDKFTISCECLALYKFKQGETGTYYLELLMDGEDGTDGWCASQGLKFASKEELQKYIEEIQDDDDKK